MDSTADAAVVTRRTVLAGGAALAGGAVGLAAPASAQDHVVGVVSEPDRWSDANVAGFMVHVGAEVDPEPDTAVPECDFRDWPPENVDPYNATLIDRKQGSSPEEDVILYVPTDVEIGRGYLFLVDNAEHCDSDYVGVELIQRGQGTGNQTIGRSVEIEDDERPNEPTGTPDEAIDTQFGPGFGPLGALVAALGLGGLLARRQQREE